MALRPVLREIVEMLETVISRLDTVLEIPRIPRQARTHLEQLQEEVTEVLDRNGNR